MSSSGIGIIDTLIISIGDNFKSPDKRISVDLYDEEQKLVTSFINDSTVYVFPKYNYSISLNIISLSNSLYIEKVDEGKFKLKIHIEGFENFKSRPIIQLAFVVDKSKNKIFYNYRKAISPNEEGFKEEYQELDTVVVKTYQVKTL